MVSISSSKVDIRWIIYGHFCNVANHHLCWFLYIDHPCHSNICHLALPTLEYPDKRSEPKKVSTVVFLICSYEPSDNHNPEYETTMICPSLEIACFENASDITNSCLDYICINCTK